MGITAGAAELRKNLVPLRLFTLPETGTTLSAISHFYYYENGLSEREELRGVQKDNTEWKMYLNEARPSMISQKSNIFVEAKELIDNFDLKGFKTPLINNNNNNNSAIYEYRRYQLKLGYDTVPLFLKHYQSGLGSKLKNKSPFTDLVSVVYSDIGTLNQGKCVCVCMCVCVCLWLS